jgi:hypothetical protein
MYSTNSEQARMFGTESTRTKGDKVKQGTQKQGGKGHNFGVKTLVVTHSFIQQLLIKHLLDFDFYPEHNRK